MLSSGDQQDLSLLGEDELRWYNPTVKQQVAADGFDVYVWARPSTGLSVGVLYGWGVMVELDIVYICEHPKWRPNDVHRGTRYTRTSVSADNALATIRAALKAADEV